LSWRRSRLSTTANDNLPSLLIRYSRSAGERRSVLSVVKMSDVPITSARRSGSICGNAGQHSARSLLLLQARGRVTAAELATELEVSVKTARRDLESLSTAGLPVYAQPGRGGGWQLLGGGRTDLSGLNAAEARALFLIAGPHTRLAPEAKAALRKLVRALPEPFREPATAAAEAVVLDPAGWGVASPKRGARRSRGSTRAAPGSRPWSWPAKRRPKGCCISSAAMHALDVGGRVAELRCTSAVPRHASSPSVSRDGATASRWSHRSSSVGSWLRSGPSSSRRMQEQSEMPASPTTERPSRESINAQLLPDSGLRLSAAGARGRRTGRRRGGGRRPRRQVPRGVSGRGRRRGRGGAGQPQHPQP
jgi:hypothetical protein